MIKLKGNVMWLIRSKNGWIRIYSVIIRWNTTWTEPYTYFSITNAKR